MILTKGKTYAADIHLTWLQNAFSNSAVEKKFEDLGFSDIMVTGTGRNRKVVGDWSGETRDVEIPDQVSNIQCQ